MPITLLCLQCHTSFTVKTYRLKQGVKFCSHHCHSLAQKRHTSRRCRHCGAAFTIPPAVVKQKGGKFCTWSCWMDVCRNTLEKMWEQIAVCSHGVSCPYCCWAWEGTTQSNGYGVFWFAGKPHAIHRFIWEVWHQQVFPAELHAAHYCHKRNCVSPSHIHPATQKGNYADSVRDDRTLFGERNPSAKLCSADIPVIFALYKQGMKQHHIAQHFKISDTHAYRILQRKIWRRVSIPDDLLL
jgi:hypothetical protein